MAKITKIQDSQKNTVSDYLDELKRDFAKYSSQIKKLKKELLKANSEKQPEIIRQIDLIAKEMEKNQKKTTKVTKSRPKERTKSKDKFPKDRKSYR
ncbi:MAG: hypothetical protein COW27_04640 [Nitrosopumilales archaeon CG15_BIG_FIL_POST_REV_8_21_14_020_37_12]|nr:MAG: hypothetical protein COW27_04640 [Nitrosopumilales archaeon CG15_BIG_FIL_POST_REV_8_21_14_020_37_12]